MKDEMPAPLYDDGIIKIDYLEGAIEDHEIFLHTPNLEDSRYIIQRGILREYANTPGNRLVEMMSTAHYDILYDILDRRISIENLGRAFLEAYNEEERRAEIAIAEIKEQIGAI